MKNKIIIKLMTVSAFVICSMIANYGYAQEENVFSSDFVVVLSKPGEPGKLYVNFTNGSIKVSAYEGKEVMISASVIEDNYTDDHCNCGDDDDDDAKKRGMKRLQNTKTTGIEAIEENNNVKISAKTWRTPIALEVKVPKNFSAKLHTVNQGEIYVENLAGDLELKNVNNDITALNIEGSVSANTVNGDVKVSINRMNSEEVMAFSTLNGDIDISLPKNMKATLSIQNDRGEIYSDFDVALKRSEPKVQERRNGGVYKVTVENKVHGDINGGGTDIRFSTMNGDIYLRKGK